MADVAPTNSMDDIVALCRRRGFIWQSSEIYGGINGFWDYGPLGAELKRNLRDAWWEDIVRADLVGPDDKPFDVVGVDCTIIMNPKVWEASGHVGGFNDPMVDDKETKQRYRADHMWVREAQGENGDSIFVAIQLGSEDEAMTAWNHYDQENRLPDDIHNSLSKAVKKILGGAYTFKDRPFTYLDVDDDQRIHVIGESASEAGTLTEPRMFNLMFETFVGAIRDEENKVYLRPETAQGIFCNFNNVVDTQRVKAPFGIAQIGKAFRNEVTPRNFTFRSREFEQMEIEFFITHPDHAGDGGLTPSDWYAYWRDSRYAWWQSIGLAGDNLQLREHDRDELAHYAKDGAGTSDIEYRFPFTAPGFGELEGVAHRTDFDLRQHAEHSGYGKKMQYFDQERNARYFPHVIEPSAGADRGTLALLCEAFTPTPDRQGSKYVMKFHPRMAPIKAAVFPLVNKDGMPEVAESLYKELRTDHPVQIDVKQSIGKRYARMDEAGTPYCFTIDGDTLSDQTVTVRDRDTAAQERIGIDKVGAFLTEKIGG
ncbi:MAG: glycine--tRNA ligase [Planctomycetaceae bacterium]|nr:glycine--tRNA ligase [Planctomycetaceae bacterium]